MTLKKTAVLFALPLLALFAACASSNSGEEITEERAIEIARQHINQDFEPARTEAVKANAEDGRPIWRVTFYAEGVTGENPGHVEIIELDRKTGEMVTVAMS